MAKAGRRKTKVEPLLADRLLALFGFELGALERCVKPLRSAEGDEVGRDAATGAKGRIEALGQMVRTLEKLLELKQLETLATGRGDEGPDAEAERLAAELMRRLRVLDRRRRSSAGGMAAGDSPVVFEVATSLAGAGTGAAAGGL